MMPALTSRFVLICFTTIGLLVGPGCNQEPAPTDKPVEPAPQVQYSGGNGFISARVSGESPALPGGEEVTAFANPSKEFDPEKLLQQQLTEEELSQGWIRLFDGQTLMGWNGSNTTNWRVEEGAIRVDKGQKGLLCTTSPFADYELTLEYQVTAKTNSGIFLRTQQTPMDVQRDCYEWNIAPPDNPFPTGSLVQRSKVESEAMGEQDHSAWHTMQALVVGDNLKLSIDGKEYLDYADPDPIALGFIGLQFNSGPAAFRNIKVRPIGGEELLPDPKLSAWKQYPEMDGKFEANEAGELHVTGGSGQLESNQKFGNFFAQLEGRTVSDKCNSGLFFRCIPGEKMNGYECQLNNAYTDGDRTKPVDSGTGAIFRRQAARIVPGDDGQWLSLTLIAYDDHIAVWVNGIQVTDFYDTRPADPNPRKGLRLEAGTLMIQAHDPTTDAEIRKLKVAELPVQR